MVKHLIRIIFLITLSFSSYAKSSNYCREYGLGWNFYCQEEKEYESDKKSSVTKNQDDYSEKMAEIKKNLEDKKAKAVIYPTQENIRDYMQYQKLVLDRSSLFADQWRRVLWQNPSLDYTLKRPVSKVAKESWIDERNKNIAKTIKRINERYGVFFLFSSTCPHCHKYSPILRNFRDKYGITIMPVSMDGGKINGWENIMINTGQVEKMGITETAVPQTLLFDKETRQVITVGAGVLSHSDLEERIYAITELEVGDDF